MCLLLRLREAAPPAVDLGDERVRREPELDLGTGLERNRARGFRLPEDFPSAVERLPGRLRPARPERGPDVVPGGAERERRGVDGADRPVDSPDRPGDLVPLAGAARAAMPREPLELPPLLEEAFRVAGDARRVEPADDGVDLGEEGVALVAHRHRLRPDFSYFRLGRGNGPDDVGFQPERLPASLVEGRSRDAGRDGEPRIGAGGVAEDLPLVVHDVPPQVVEVVEGIAVDLREEVLGLRQAALPDEALRLGRPSGEPGLPVGVERVPGLLETVDRAAGAGHGRPVVARRCPSGGRAQGREPFLRELGAQPPHGVDDPGDLPRRVDPLPPSLDLGVRAARTPEEARGLAPGEALRGVERDVEDCARGLDGLAQVALSAFREEDLPELGDEADLLHAAFAPDRQGLPAVDVEDLVRDAAHVGDLPGGPLRSRARRPLGEERGADLLELLRGGGVEARKGEETRGEDRDQDDGRTAHATPPPGPGRPARALTARIGTASRRSGSPGRCRSAPR